MGLVLLYLYYISIKAEYFSIDFVKNEYRYYFLPSQVLCVSPAEYSSLKLLPPLEVPLSLKHKMK